MVEVFRDFQKNARTARSLIRQQRALALRLRDEDTMLIDGTRAAINSSRALMRKADEAMGGK